MSRSCSNPDRDSKGRFRKGWRGGPGRPPGSKNKNPPTIPLADLAAAYEKHGAAMLAKLRPKDFLRLVIRAMTLPMPELTPQEKGDRRVGAPLSAISKRAAKQA